ncbi:MAG TPA: hypothetical protein VD761_03590 [Solirubrobacterales bacterium]|nr:hypothetical protein [Solirubrobacterales bacterium]
MKQKLMLLATGALTALAFAALPAAASAGTPEVHCPNGAASCAISIAGGHSELTKTNSFVKVTCTSTTGTGSLNTTGGTIQLTFHGCKESVFGTSCTTAGQSSGTIKTTVLPVDNRYVTAGKTAPGVLITPASGSSHFATFNCIDGTHVVTGNGVMGILTTGCASPQAALKLKFSQSSAGHQLHKQVTGSGTIFDLHEGANTAAMVAEGSVTPTGGGSFTVTCV